MSVPQDDQPDAERAWAVQACRNEKRPSEKNAPPADSRKQATPDVAQKCDQPRQAEMIGGRWRQIPPSLESRQHLTYCNAEKRALPAHAFMHSCA